MNFERLCEEFQAEDFDPIPELVGSGIVVGTRDRPPHLLTYQAATGMLSVHGAIATGLLLQPGETITFEVTITQRTKDQAKGAVATSLKHPEKVGDRFTLISGLYGALKGLRRAID